MKNKLSSFVRANFANFLTLLNLIFGLLSIISSIDGRFRWAVAFIGFAGLADRYDGRVARHMGTESELGVQLDSLGDAVSFGIAPALLIFLAFQPRASSALIYWIHVAICVIYISCGLFRLARYNITGTDAEGFFDGLPITAAGMIVAFSSLFHRELNYWFYGVLLLLLSFMMVSRIKIKKR